MERCVLALLLGMAAVSSSQAGRNFFAPNDSDPVGSTTARAALVLMTETSPVASRIDFSQSDSRRRADQVNGALIGKPIIRFSRNREFLLQPVFGSVNGLQLSLGF
jgi:hypothetical protein